MHLKRKMPLKGDDAAKQAENLRREGNSLFKKGRFGAAVAVYTEAIALCPNVPIYWTNRALCHRKQNNWKRVEEDCRRAIQLEHNSVKAHYMLGLALLQGQDYAGVKQLEKAFELCRTADSHSIMVEEIWQALSNAKYLEWECKSTKRSWDMQKLKEDTEAALKEKHFVDHLEFEGFLAEYTRPLSKNLETLEWVFSKATENDTPAEVPDYLCCKITLSLLRDPVITPSGITYERAAILAHLQKVGYFDPVTRKPLNALLLLPNLAIKEAVQAFLDKHGWAYKID